MPIFRKKVVSSKECPSHSVKDQNEEEVGSLSVTNVDPVCEVLADNKQATPNPTDAIVAVSTIEDVPESPKRAPKKERNFHERNRRNVEVDGNIIANHASVAEVEQYTANHRNDVFVFGFHDISVTLEESSKLLDRRLIHNIKTLHGYNEFLPLQERCIAILLHETKPNVLVQSPTGSGKTAAFSIPAVQYAISNKRKAPSVIIVCNTMNLAHQIHKHLALFTGKISQDIANKMKVTPEYTGIEVFGMYKGGDVSRHQRLNERTQPDIVIATMGSLIDNIEKERLKLFNLGLLIVDEADKMSKEGGFAEEMRRFFDLIPSNIKEQLQVAAFSATYCELENTEGNVEWEVLSETTLGKMYNTKPVTIKLIGTKGYIKQRLIRIDDVYTTATPSEYSDSFKRAELARKMVSNTYHSKKLGWLMALLDRDREQYFIDGKYIKTAVVFVERITTSNFLATYLIMKGYKVAPLNSNYDLQAVQEILMKLVNGEIQAVISTNKLARGQDIPDLHHVIVYEMSNEFTDYKHRIGRTGRIGKGGISTALLTRQDSKHFASLYDFLYFHKQHIPEWLHEYCERAEEQMNRYNDEEYAIHTIQENFALPESDVSNLEMNTSDQII